MAPIKKVEEKSPRRDSAGLIELSASAEYNLYDKDLEFTTYVNCHLKAPEVEDCKRKPIDLVVVLDRSGSMSGEKLRLCKETISFLISELTCNDRFALITYDDKVSTTISLLKMNQAGKEFAKHHVNKVITGGSTNLSGGLLAGIMEVQKPERPDGAKPNEIKSVLLLTDGHANKGLTTQESISKMLEGSLASNVSLFTFGYGSNHNSDMLREISDIGRGMYYFVECIDSVSVAFADCLGGLLSVVGQCIKLQCQAINDVKILHIETQKPLRVIQKEKYIEVDVGDIYAEEARDILLQIRMPALPNAESEFPVVKFILNYANVLTSSMQQSTLEFIVDRPEDSEKERINNSDVTQQINRITAAKALESAKVAASNGKYAEGQSNINNAITSISKTIECLSVEEREMTSVLLNDLEESMNAISTRDKYESIGSKKLTSTTQCYVSQRSNTCSHSSVPTKFRSKKKASMVSKLFSRKEE